MSAYVIRPARAGDAELLAPAMRPEDAAEVLAADGASPLEALRRSMELSEVAFALELGGELAALFGVCPGPREAMLGPRLYDEIWMLTGVAVGRHPVAFMNACRVGLAALLQRYPVLLNVVDARYAASIRWARRLGAEIRPDASVGASGLPFHRVTWRSPWVQ